MQVTEDSASLGSTHFGTPLLPCQETTRYNQLEGMPMRMGWGTTYSAPIRGRNVPCSPKVICQHQGNIAFQDLLQSNDTKCQ